MALSRCRGIAVPTSKTQAEKHAEERAKARNTCRRNIRTECMEKESQELVTIMGGMFH